MFRPGYTKSREAPRSAVNEKKNFSLDLNQLIVLNNGKTARVEGGFIFYVRE